MAKKKVEEDFNPIKVDKSGQSDATIWSTRALNMAVEGLNQGLQLKSNPFIGKNTKLLKPDIVYKRTKEELDDYIHCMQDPVYFASKCYLMTPEGLQPVTLRDYQIEYIKHCQKNRFSIFLSCRQSGKCQLISSQLVIRFCLTNSLSEDKQSLLNKYSIGEYIYRIPAYELFNILLENKSEDWIKRIELYRRLDNGEKVYSEIEKLDSIYSDSLEKIVESINVNGIEVLTDTGFKPFSKLYLTKPFDVYKLTLANGYTLECADTHIVFGSNFNEVYVKDLSIGDYIQTDSGLKEIVSIEYSKTKVCMFDITVDDNNHRFYSNGILSHNSTTTAIYCLWMILFHTDKNALILSKSGAAGVDLVSKIKDMYLYLPYHLKCGTLKWNQTSISFDNSSSISTEAFSPTAGLGKTINFLILDEFAWCPPNEVELFYNNIIPTVTTISDSNVCIMSTQNGFNLFYKLWQGAITKKNIYGPFKVDWDQVPQFNTKTKKWEKRTEDWHKMMVGILGSEEAFQYQYGTSFSASDNCLVSRETMAKIRDKSILYEHIPESENYFNLTKQELYIKPNYSIQNFKNKHYVILVDLAEGGGGDYTIFNILEIVGKDKFSQVAFWRCNNVDIEHAALEFWVMFSQLFTAEKTLISIEWNTYGALFYNYLMNLNETDYMSEHSWRFRYGNELDMNSIIYYKKGANEEDVAGINIGSRGKMVPGIRFNGSNKVTACALLKMMLEKGDIEIEDLVTVSELENFEDKNGNGSYKASYGHDDLIMTFCQVPMLMQTSKYKFFMEEIEGIIKTEQRKNLIEDKFESVDFYNANQQVPNLFDTEQDSGLFAVPQASNLFGTNPFIQQQFNDSGIGGSGFTSLY